MHVKVPNNHLVAMHACIVANMMLFEETRALGSSYENYKIRSPIHDLSWLLRFFRWAQQTRKEEAIYKLVGHVPLTIMSFTYSV